MGFSGMLCLLLSATMAAARNVTLPSQCPCGFQNPSTEEVFTDSIIMYFNETGVDSDVFNIRDYQLQNQKGWNSIFKQGARPENVGIGNNDSLSWQDAIDGTSPSLEMFLDGIDFEHYSKGAELQSVRRDIMFGYFRASMRSAQPYVGGSAMSMYVQYNDSQQLYMDLLNMDSSNEARVMQTINGEWPDNMLGVNYTLLEQGDQPRIPPIQPWDFMDVGFDWNKTSVSFWIGNNRTRHVKSAERTLPGVPETLYLSHWSNGDTNYMQGPPVNRSVANVRWIRAFFNSSLMTSADHKSYDQKCNVTAPCSVDDISLRGSTAYSQAATVEWQPPSPNDHIRVVAGIVAACFSIFGVTSMVNALVRRGPWHRFKRIRIPGTKRHSTQALRQSLQQSIGPGLTRPPPETPHEKERRPDGVEPPAPGYTSRGEIQVPTHGLHSGTMTPLPPYESRRTSPWQSVVNLVTTKRPHRSGRVTPSQSRTEPWSLSTQTNYHGSGASSPTHNPPVVTEEEEDDESKIQEARRQAYRELGGGSQDDDDQIKPVSSSTSKSDGPFEEIDQDQKKEVRVFRSELFEMNDDKAKQFRVPIAPQDQSVAQELREHPPVPDAITGAATAEPSVQQKPQAPNQPGQRIDYLAGLVAISCIMVTLRHFSLTFWPYVTEASGPIMHFQADRLLSYILGPYFLTPLWIGPFFVTSCRFLAQRYLRTGKLNDIANKMLLRAPRMLIPVFVFMTLEYFLISLGLTAKLEWLPSVTYSTWPYVIPQPNFGVFLNELVEISYLIPNAAPEVINHYCVGVLWTIPVQLQFSFVVLLATVLIKDVKRPWKRMLFYSLSILAGWYASSWSACHWLGLLLADLDITYDWVRWTQARWWALYPTLFLSAGIAFATPLVLLFNSEIYYFSFMSWENAIHPDPTTGRPIFELEPTIYDAYPAYYTPSLAVLTFSVGLQICVELSTWVQKALSIKIITFFHPHIMTIYLMHGFIFWSLGSYIAVALSSTKIPYWATLIIVAVVCYAVIFILAMMITPLIEFTTKGSSKNIWRWATEEPVPHRETTAPFSKNLILGRQMDESKAKEDGSA